MHPVLRLIHQRALEGSRPGSRRDGFKLGLAVEGGGMRGVVSGGMLITLEQLGLRDVFDAVYGSSAGAINAAYFIAGQCTSCGSIYYEDVCDRRFINPLRRLAGKPVMSLDYLLDQVMTEVKPLDWEAVIASPVRLKILATSLKRLSTVVFDDFKSRDELFLALRATATIPILAGPPVSLNQDHFLDAAVFESIPFPTAINDGCSHVLALRTRPDGVLRSGPSFLERLFIVRGLSRLRPGLEKVYLNCALAYAEEVKRLTEASRNPSGPPYLLAISLPAGTPLVGRLERRRSRLIAGAIQGAKAALKTLTGQTGQVREVVGIFLEKGRWARGGFSFKVN